MLLWLDLETTGLDPATEHVLEVGAILTTDDLEEQRRLNIVVEFAGEVENSVVREMHEENGLLAACQFSAVTESEAGWILHDWLEEYMNGHEVEPMTLAGSGVAHFDLPWLKAKWPKVVEKLTYWVIDVGIMRRGNRLCGIEMPTVEESSGPRKMHRAMGDVEAHLTEMRLLKEVHRHG